MSHLCGVADSLLVRRGAELAGELEGYRSLKAKRYRIIYRLNDSETSVEIYLVGHRRDVYDTLRSLLLGVKQITRRGRAVSRRRR